MYSNLTISQLLSRLRGESQNRVPEGHRVLAGGETTGSPRHTPLFSRTRPGGTPEASSFSSATQDIAILPASLPERTLYRDDFVASIPVVSPPATIRRPSGMNFGRKRVLPFTLLASVVVIASISSPHADDKRDAFALKMAGETPLEALPKRSKTRIYRLIIAPAWGSTFSIRIENDDKGAEMMVNRRAYRDMIPAERKTIRLTAEEFLAFEELVRKSGYGEMKTLDKTSGFDGEIWSLEISRAQFHEMISSWCPDLDPRDRGTEGFVKVFKWVTDKAALTKTITNKGHPIFGR